MSFLDTIIRECPLHGRWIFTDTPDGNENARQFDHVHQGHSWPVSTRRFPAKSRKRVAA